MNIPWVVDRLPVDPGFRKPWTNIRSRYSVNDMMGRIASIYAGAGGFSVDHPFAEAVAFLGMGPPAWGSLVPPDSNSSATRFRAILQVSRSISEPTNRRP